MEYAWIVSRDNEVEAVLTCGALRVRPADRLPKAMQGTLLGAVFERLVRMNDGERHAVLRRRIEELLAQWDLDRVECIARAGALRLQPADVAAYAVGTLIGLSDPEAAIPWIRDFAGAIAGGADDEAIARGIAVTKSLLDALPHGMDADDAANMLGLLFQSYAATARLIDNVLTGRSDPPVTVTRRYAAEDVELCKTKIRKGDALAVLLISPRFHFGAGRHACPGREIAETIATAAAAVIAQNLGQIAAQSAPCLPEKSSKLDRVDCERPSSSV